MLYDSLPFTFLHFYLCHKEPYIKNLENLSRLIWTCRILGARWSTLVGSKSKSGQVGLSRRVRSGRVNASQSIMVRSQSCRKEMQKVGQLVPTYERVGRGLYLVSRRLKQLEGGCVILNQILRICWSLFFQSCFCIFHSSKHSCHSITFASVNI